MVDEQPATATPTFVAPTVAARQDPDLAEIKEPSLLELLAEVAEPVTASDVVLPVPTRPGWAVRFSTELTAEQLKAYEKRSTVKGALDQFRFSLIILAAACRAIIRDSVDVTDNDGQPVTFGHPALWQTYNTSSAADTVRSFYGLDNTVATVFTALMAEMGGDEVAPLDPTPGS